MFFKMTVLALGVLVSLSANSSRSQTSDQKLLAETLRFYFVAEPNNADAASYTPELLDNEAIQAEKREGSFWTNTSAIRLQELVRALLCDLGDGGDATLQRYAARIVSIKGKPIDVYLIDDATETLNENAQTRWGKWISKKSNRVYPSAVDMAASEELRTECERRKGLTPSPRRDEGLAGEMAIGAQVDLKAGKGNAIPLFLHALVHTQDGSCSMRHAYGPLGYPTDDNGRRPLAYATFPDLKTAYREAIAHTFTMWYSRERYEAMFSTISPGTTLLTEKDPYPSFMDFTEEDNCPELYVPSAGGWLCNELLTGAPSNTHESEYEDYSGFVSIKMGDLPDAILGQNEYILALVFCSYLPHVDRDAFLDIVQKVDTERPENVSPTTYLFQLLCEASPAESRGSTGLLPFAYFDYFTGFKAKDLEEFRSCFDDTPLVEEWLEPYWNKCHEGVKAAVTPKSGNSELSDIAEIDKVVLKSGGTQE